MPNSHPSHGSEAEPDGDSPLPQGHAHPHPHEGDGGGSPGDHVHGDHDHDHDHDHADDDHDHAHGHSHAGLASTDPGAMRVIAVSTLLLAAVAAAELTAAVVSHSAGVLADALHNLGDVSSTVALGAAFLISRRAPSRRFPYGYHRAEDLAGLLVLLLMIGSAVAAGVTAIEHLVHPATLTSLPLALAVAIVGFAGNEAAALYKTRAGRRMHSSSLEADGQHSRIDGLASLGAAAGVIGAMAGVAVIDALAGLVIAVVIAVVAWHTAATVTGRLLEEADASLVAVISETAGAVRGVERVTGVRAHWVGRTVRTEITIEADASLHLSEAHALSETVRHSLYHRIESVAEVLVHVDPAGDAAAHEELEHHLRRIG